jgi:hypothetical protein
MENGQSPGIAIPEYPIIDFLGWPVFFQRLVVYRDPSCVRKRSLCPAGITGLAENTRSRSEATQISRVDDQPMDVRISGQFRQSLRNFG